MSADCDLFLASILNKLYFKLKIFTHLHQFLKSCLISHARMRTELPSHQAGSQTSNSLLTPGSIHKNDKLEGKKGFTSSLIFCHLLWFMFYIFCLSVCFLFVFLYFFVRVQICMKSSLRSCLLLPY